MNSTMEIIQNQVTTNINQMTNKSHKININSILNYCSLSKKILILFVKQTFVVTPW